MCNRTLKPIRLSLMTTHAVPGPAAKARGAFWNVMAALLCMALLSISTGAQAQECPSPERHKISTRVPLMRNMINPNPMDFDFELPIPCGGKLVFRLVSVPADEYFDGLDLQMGCDNCGRETEGYMEEKRPANLSGAFTMDNLPEPWQATLARMAAQEEGVFQRLENQRQAPLFYFISKYEITNFHWDAVMGDECPGWDRLFNPDDPRPKTNLSWFEAVEFTRRLTEWLLNNHPENLPAFPDGRFGFVRLPTEIEWEYAARGGHLVPADRMNQEAFFPLKNRDLMDYAVYTEPSAPKLPEGVAWVGTKCANPLGLFDALGNASEMIMEPFRFSLQSGLHGAAGGFLIKGGSYRKSSREIMPGRREEIPYYLDKGAFRSNDVGFRVALAGIVTARDRLEDLKEQWAAHTTKRALKETLKKWTAADEGLAPSVVLEKQRVGAAIWKALFMLESLVKYYESGHKARDEFNSIEKMTEKSLPASELIQITTRKEELTQQLDMGETAINDLLQAYFQTILVIKALPSQAYHEQLITIGRERGGHPSDPLSLTSRLAMIEKHTDTLSPHSRDDQFSRILNDIISIADIELE